MKYNWKITVLCKYILSAFLKWHSRPKFQQPEIPITIKNQILQLIFQNAMYIHAHNTGKGK